MLRKIIANIFYYSTGIVLLIVLSPMFIMAIPRTLEALFDALSQLFARLDRAMPRCKWLDSILEFQRKFRGAIYKQITDRE